MIQILPLRGILGNELWPLPVIFREPAWNPVNSLREARTPDEAVIGSHNPMDWLFFPNKQDSARVFSRLPGQTIDHEFSSDGKPQLVELCPELLMTPEQIVDRCKRTGSRLVLDTEHLGRQFRESSTHYGQLSPLANDQTWRQAIDVLAPHIDVMHVKSTTGLDADIVRHFLSRARLRNITIIAEYKPSKASLVLGFIYAHRFLVNLKYLCEAA